MALQIIDIARNGNNCQHLVFDCVLEGDEIIIRDELEKLESRFEDEPGGYKGLLLRLFALYQIEQGRKIETLHLYIA